MSMRTALLLSVVTAAAGGRLLAQLNPNAQGQEQAISQSNQLDLAMLSQIGQNDKWSAWPRHTWAHTASNVPLGGGAPGPDGSVSQHDVSEQLEEASAHVPAGAIPMPAPAGASA